MKAAEFIEFLKQNGVSDFTGVPCSIFKEVIDHLEKHESYLIASSEGEAMGIAGGIAVAGRVPAVIMQNDGFGNTVNPLTSLTKLYELPAVLVISWRGEPGKKDAPQHVWSGRTLIDLMKVFEIDFILMEPDLNEQKAEISGLIEKARAQNKVVALIVRAGVFEEAEIPQPKHDDRLSRRQAIETVMELIDDDTPVFSATGKPSRELYTVRDRKNNFYVVGSMGCTSSIAFGYYLKTGKKTVVLDGDGGVLMKMGTLATLGFYQPEKFLHICLDNETYESTGGQTTAASVIDLSAVARACKYPNVAQVKTANEIRSFIKAFHANPRLSFLHIKVKNETEAGLGRPKEKPAELKHRFMESGK